MTTPCPECSHPHTATIQTDRCSNGTIRRRHECRQWLVTVADTPTRTRTARWRRRLAGLPDPDAPQPCPQCGRLVRSTKTAPLCSQCWKRSPAGREANRQRMAAALEASTQR